MGGLILLARARAEGLSVFRNGDKLVVKGPGKAEPLARELLAAKPAVLTALSVEAALGLSSPWREEAIAECRRRTVAAADLIREFARSRWTTEADTWPVELLSGFYVRDLLAGMEAVLGSWGGWTVARERLDRGSAGGTIARLWSAYATLPVAHRCEVIDRGDRSQSPPACLVAGPGEARDA